jgi:alkanesulfonate monooxygenase SsuD/methylene tetrahydromethanopterin reductase-like flavin-dependent oxidoreductase (luciferase family)
MKFSLFAHAERYGDEFSHKQLLDELTEFTLMAEAGGMETMWIGEHHAMDFTVAPNPFINLSYLAAKTSTIRLGTGNVIAPFWHPIRLAGEAGMCDVLSNGRLDLGIARGAYMFEYERMMPGLEALEAGLRMRELVPAIQGLFKGNYTHDGEYWQFPSTTPVPFPIQKPGPPIWIAARDPHTHDFAVASGCHVQVTPLAIGDDEVADLMNKFNTAVANHPEVPRPEVMLLMHTYVAETEAELQSGSEALQKFFLYFTKWFKREAPIVNAQIEALTTEEYEGSPQYSPEVLRKNLLVGTPDEVIARLKKFEELGYDQFSIWLDSAMTYEQKHKSLKLFIDKVMPAFAN